MQKGKKENESKIVNISKKKKMGKKKNPKQNEKTFKSNTV